MRLEDFKMADPEEPTTTVANSVSRPIPEAKPAKKKRKREKVRSPRARFVISVSRLLIIGYATVLIALALMESRLVYPGAYFGDDPSREGNDPAIETVEYASTDGMMMRGRLLELPQPKHVVLFFHGNGVKAKWMDRWLKHLAAEFNATVMAAEYRGFDDDAAPSERGVLSDCFAARDYLCDRLGKSPDEIVLYGQSLGGGCAVAVASQGGAKALVLERTFDRLVTVAAAKCPFIPVRVLMKNRYDSVAKITVYKGPLIVLHGTTDSLIPMKHAEALFQGATTKQKHWIAVEGLGHNDPLPIESLREIVSKVNEFAASESELRLAKEL